MPVLESAKASKPSLRKYLHDCAFLASDVDPFLCSMTPEKAEGKINAIYEVMHDWTPRDVTCIHTTHTMSIYLRYPYHAVRIILRLDIDAPYWTARGVGNLPRHCHHDASLQHHQVAVLRGPPGKYSSATLKSEVYVPQLDRADFEPTVSSPVVTFPTQFSPSFAQIFERSSVRIQGGSEAASAHKGPARATCSRTAGSAAAAAARCPETSV